MAHFYGSLQGSRGVATRLGTKTSGLHTYAASWQGKVTTDLYEKDGVDYATVRLAPHHNAGISKLLYDGPVGGKRGGNKTVIHPTITRSAFR